ncbi:MAG: outer membrane beta-barrel protein [Spirochaetia bacterium]|nr:outer membrane beta-barrel protein [Spirochaetia bacterium]
MKKYLLILIIVLSVLTLPAATYDKADGFGIGLSAGYPVAGGAFKYGMGDFRIVGTLGYSFNDSFAVEAGVQYDLDRFYVDRLPFYVNIGITGAVNFSPVIEGFSINIPVGISYFLMDAPVEFFFKLTPGVKIRSTSAEPDLGAAIGVLFYINR